MDVHGGHHSWENVQNRIAIQGLLKTPKLMLVPPNHLLLPFPTTTVFTDLGTPRHSWYPILWAPKPK